MLVLLNDMTDFRPWIYFKSILALNWTLSISNGMERILCNPVYATPHMTKTKQDFS